MFQSALFKIQWNLRTKHKFNIKRKKFPVFQFQCHYFFNGIQIDATHGVVNYSKYTTPWPNNKKIYYKFVWTYHKLLLKYIY